jgi:hypothetical protein
VFAMRGAGGGADLPHDLVHAVVETQLQVPDGIWGCVADGVVWRSMRHLSGRRPPHAAERSTRLKRERAAAVQRAEAVPDLVSRLARGAAILPDEGTVQAFPTVRLRSAARALREAQALWADLAPGESHVFDWKGARGPRLRTGER